MCTVGRFVFMLMMHLFCLAACVCVCLRFAAFERMKVDLSLPTDCDSCDPKSTPTSNTRTRSAKSFKTAAISSALFYLSAPSLSLSVTLARSLCQICPRYIGIWSNLTGSVCRIEQQCPRGWWGSPTCGPCHCEASKGFDTDCNKTTGHCHCKVHTTEYFT